MTLLTVWHEETEAGAVGGTIHHAGSGLAFLNLTLAGGEGIGLVSVTFEFPTDDKGVREPRGESGEPFDGGLQLNRDRARAGGDFANTTGRGGDFEVAECGGMEEHIRLEGAHEIGERLIRAKRENCAVFRGGGCGAFTSETNYLPARIVEGAGEEGADFAGRSVCEAAHVIQRSISRAAGHDYALAVRFAG